MTNTTLNPSDKNTGITLSNGNLTATNNNNVQPQGVRAAHTLAIGKYYWECTYNQNNNVCDAVGIIKGTTPLNTQMNFSSSGQGYCCVAPYSNGQIYNDGAGSGQIGSIVSGSVVCIAFDVDNGKIWFRLGGGNWNGSGSANPATGTGGISVLNVNEFPLVQVASTNSQITANFGDSAFTGAVPAGFRPGWPTAPVLGISGSGATTAFLGVVYGGFTVTGIAGTTPYTYSVASGTLPPGLTLNSSTGVVSGTPTALGTYPGIVLRVTDATSTTADLPAFSMFVNPPGTHRYWRLAMAAAGDLYNFAFSELQFRTTAGVPQLFSGGTISVSSSYNASSNPPSRVTDGNINTWWAANSAAGEWWAYDYGVGNPINIVEVYIVARNDSYWNQAPRLFTIQFSDDGVTWYSTQPISTSWSAQGQAQSFAVTTPIGSTVLLCHFDGSFSDDTGHTLTASNATINTTNPKFGTGCGDFTASPAANVSVDAPADFNFGQRQFTVEAWAYFTTAPSGVQAIAAQFGGSGNLGWFFGFVTGALSFYFSTNGGDNPNVSGGYTPPLNTWVHLAADRDAVNMLRVYANGVVIASNKVNANFYASTRNCVIGNDQNFNRAFPGRLDELRINNGLAYYAGAFAPPAAPFVYVPATIYERMTQIVLEQWAQGAPVGRMTQAALEEWGAVNPTVQLTQLVIEEWASLAGVGTFAARFE